MTTMSQPQKKNWLSSLPPWVRTGIGIGIIAVAVVWGVAYGPRYNDTNTTTGEGLPQPVEVTGSVSKLELHRSLVYQGVSVTVTDVEQAQAFSDDGKSTHHKVPYIIRLNLHVQSPSSQAGPVGIEYPKVARLVLADGTELTCNLADISPAILPGHDEEGFLDFWVDQTYTLSTLSFALGENKLAFG
jgi:hypothetical protein